MRKRITPSAPSEMERKRTPLPHHAFKPDPNVSMQLDFSTNHYKATLNMLSGSAPNFY